MKRFILLSDIHACADDPASSNAPSYVSSFNAAATGKTDPLTDLERLIRSEKLAPDFILCAGDITNRSDPNSFSYAWAKLDRLAMSCNAQLISTVGNHDLDSRYQANKYDPRGYAMSLAPKIPISDRSSFLEFWAEHHTLISSNDCNILVLNTAAFHGSGADAIAEIEHGRISEITLATIEETLGKAPRRPVNVLLCHHHPIKGDQGDQELIGLTRGGDRLIAILEHTDQPWIIVHGHKHRPDLFYGHGGANAPVILGCGSFSSQVNRDAQNKNPNQVHLLVSDSAGATSAGLTSAGHVNSWTWQAGVGWSKSKDTQGLPHFAGFGYRGSVNILAEQLDSHLTASGLPQIPWRDAIKALPSLRMLIPNDFGAFKRALSKIGLTILDIDGNPAQVGRRA